MAQMNKLLTPVMCYVNEIGFVCKEDTSEAVDCVFGGTVSSIEENALQMMIALFYRYKEDLNNIILFGKKPILKLDELYETYNVDMKTYTKLNKMFNTQWSDNYVQASWNIIAHDLIAKNRQKMIQEFISKYQLKGE